MTTPRPHPFPQQVPPMPPASGGVRLGDGQVPWSWLDALGAFLVMLPLVVVVNTVLFALEGLGVLGEGLAGALFLPLSLMMLAVTALVWVRVRYPGSTRLLVGPARVRGTDVLLGIGLGLGAYLVINVGMGVLLQVVANLADVELPTVQEEFREAARDRRMAPYFAVGAVLAAPVAEELFFRGMLFQALRRHVGLWPGVLLSAVAFAFAHINQGAGLEANALVFALIFPLGVLLAWLLHWRGTLLVPILVHAVFNVVSVALLLSGVG